MKDWVRMPTTWIANKENPGLAWFAHHETGAGIAALILYIALVHDANDKKKTEMDKYGEACLTYDDLEDVTNLSRAMISKGIQLLKSYGLISIVSQGNRNIYKIMRNSLDRGWGKMPKYYFYSNKCFDKFTHRGKNELNALKILLLLAAFRDRNRNITLISFTRISEYTGIQPYNIRAALSLLVNNSLIHIDSSSEVEGYKGNPPNQYRICGIDPYRHRGTQRNEDDEHATESSLDEMFN